MLAAGLLVPHASGQASSPGLGSGRMPPPPLNNDDGGLINKGTPNDPMAVQQEARRARILMDERQRKMQEDTAKLLKLAEELKAEMEKTNKFQMSVDVIRKAEEIEKLARDVKNRMKG